MRKNSEHGTTGSYVIGFVLSLIFTIIPYYMVINKSLPSYTLLITILGIGLVQMFIQIFFFLHLGRGPKPFYNVVFFFATAGLIVIVVGASVLIMQNLYRTMTPKEATIKQAQRENISQVGGDETGACSQNKASHVITISTGMPNPMHVQAQRCDTLTFVNKDDQVREVTFGTHPEHASYGGEDRVVLDGEHPETITLNESGNFVFHDHMDPNMHGSFSVSH